MGRGGWSRFSCEPHTGETIAKHMVWLAFDAAMPIGMGILNVDRAEKASMDDVWEDCVATTEMGDSINAHVDYAHGRQMKMDFRYPSDKTQQWVEIKLGELNKELQSWSSEYNDYRALFIAALQLASCTPADPEAIEAKEPDDPDDAS